MSRQIKFGDHVIEGIETWRSGYDSRAFVDVFPRRDGGIVQSSTFQNPRTVTVTGIVGKSTEALLATYMDDMAERLVNLGLSSLYKDAADTRYLNAIMRRFEEQESAAPDMLPTLERQFLIEFLCHDPFWYAAAESSDLDWVPVASPESNSITNAGGAPTFPRFEIENTSGGNLTGTFSLRNVTLSMTVEWTGTINTGATLVIDCGEHTVVQGSTSLINGLESGTAFFNLILGANEIEYEGDLNVSIDSFWTHRWGS
jgi:hypothetical protein